MLNAVKDDGQEEDDFKKAFKTLAMHIDNNKDDLHDLAVDTMIASGRLYSMSSHLIQLVTCVGDAASWADSVPQALTEDAALKKRKKTPSSMGKNVQSHCRPNQGEDRPRGDGEKHRWPFQAERSEEA